MKDAGRERGDTAGPRGLMALLRGEQCDPADGVMGTFNCSIRRKLLFILTLTALLLIVSVLALGVGAVDIPIRDSLKVIGHLMFPDWVDAPEADYYSKMDCYGINQQNEDLLQLASLFGYEAIERAEEYVDMFNDVIATVARAGADFGTDVTAYMELSNGKAYTSKAEMTALIDLAGGYNIVIDLVANPLPRLSF